MAMAPPSSGFTLAELLVVAVIGCVIMGAASTSLLPNIRSGITTERAQSLRNDLNRIAFLLETEISEGEGLRYGVAMTGSCTGVTGNSLFTIDVPTMGGTGTTLASTPIHYYVTGTGNTAGLNRCGPPIQNNGRLALAGTRVAAPVSENTTLTLANTTNPKLLTYDLTVRDPSATQALSRNAITTATRVTLIN